MEKSEKEGEKGKSIIARLRDTDAWGPRTEPASRWAGAPKRLTNFAGCEVETSQGANLELRRVRNVGAALGDSSGRYRVAAVLQKRTNGDGSVTLYAKLRAGLVFSVR